MKKVISLVLLLFAGLFIVGCSNEFKDSLKIKLNADPSSGYTWEYDFTDAGIAKAIEDNDIDCDEEEKTCKGYQIYTIEALSKGETYLNFKYTNGTDVLYTAKYEIEVNKDLKIKEVRHMGTYFKR